jgi:hypothetical protein
MTKYNGDLELYEQYKDDIESLIAKNRHLPNYMILMGLKDIIKDLESLGEFN